MLQAISHSCDNGPDQPPAQSGWEQHLALPCAVPINMVRGFLFCVGAAPIGSELGRAIVLASVHPWKNLQGGKVPKQQDKMSNI